MRWTRWLSSSTLIVMMLISLMACSDKIASFNDDDFVYLVTTDSMEPTFSIGDKLYYEPVDSAELECGDVIVYWTVVNGERVMNAHRIVAISQINEDTLAFTTQGDNNVAPDSQYVHQKDVLGKVVKIDSKSEKDFLKNNK